MYTNAFNQKLKEYPEEHPMVFKEWIPGPKAEVPVAAFETSSLLGIKGSLSWSFTRNDRRKVTEQQLRGRGAENLILKGITMRNHQLTGH
eukprot:10288897-Lingulodinium_polyedra.AAC.1